MTEGIIFVATQESNIKQALLAVKSIRKQGMTIPVTLFTNTPEGLSQGVFDQVIRIEKKGGQRILKTYDKVLQFKNTPYDRTLFLDTDVFVLDDLTEMFRLLDKFDMAFSFAHVRAKTIRMYSEQGALGNDAIPYAFPTLQSGVVLYKKNEIVWNILETFQRLYEEKNYYFDQASFKEVIWNSDIRMWILPEEYNFSDISLLKKWVQSDLEIAIPKIFHYTQNKEDDVEALIKAIIERNDVQPSDVQPTDDKPINGRSYFHRLKQLFD